MERDIKLLNEGHALCWDAAICQRGDFNLFEKLFEELKPWKASPYKRSRHPACITEELLLQSKTYVEVKEWVERTFVGFKLGYSIANLYADGGDWTEMHRDNFKSGGNRIEGVEDGVNHNCTIGVSFGGDRDLRFKHLKTEFEFSFPQCNGDVFAFTSAVNSQFQHAIPQVLPKHRASPRISLIFWGHVPNESLRTH